MRKLVLALLAVLLLGAVVFVLLRPDVDDGVEDTTATALPPASAPRAAPVDGPVARVATGPGAPGALSLVAEAPTLVLAGTDGQLAAAHLALRLRAPLLVIDEATGASEQPTGAGVDPKTDADGAVTEARRLGVTRAVVVGTAGLADVIRRAGLAEVVQLDPPPDPPGRTRAVIQRTAGDDRSGRRPDLGFPPQVVRELLAQRPPPPGQTGTVVLVHPDDRSAVPSALAARAVGHRVVPTTAGDLRTDGAAVRRIGRAGTPAEPPAALLAGTRMASRDAADVARQVTSAATGLQIPGGGQLVVDPDRPRARRYIGLYGTPGSAALGVLGEQPADASVRRVRRLARQYREVVAHDVTVVPCFEIIATVASSSAGKDGNFSNELPIRDLRPAVEAARHAGVYVLLDLQPGRTDFLTQAKRYQPLLRQPHVGLALDPEWRLRPGERHLEQIGSVGIAEVNEVGTWLADLVERERLPQKMFLLHQFRLSMIRNRQRLDTSREELAHVIQMDGQGAQGTKLETWRALTADPPGDALFGWKNFYDEDSPLRSPARTMALRPTPVFVSYQ